MKNNSKILEVNSEGLKIEVDNELYFLDYETYPWFENAKIYEFYNLEHNQKCEHFPGPTWM